MPYGKGYTLAAKEFDECLRSILQMDYGLVLISHATDKIFKDINGQEYNKIIPTLANKPSLIVSRMADIMGYSRVVQDEQGNTVTKLFTRGTVRFEAGSRFKYITDKIDFNYDSLVAAICDAIDKEEQEKGKEFFTDRASNLYNKNTTEELDFDDLFNQFNDKVEDLMNIYQDKFSTVYGPKITQIVEKYLGKGQKVSNISRDQVEALSLIVDEVKDII